MKRNFIGLVLFFGLFNCGFSQGSSFFMDWLWMQKQNPL
jgi:hypothetical protein